MNVSLCMIVRNEEANLEDCLESINGLVSEVVVVDTGSVDATKGIALQHGARVFDFRWCDDFAAARNESIRHALGDWIFWLDADDRIEARSQGQLRELFSTLPDSLDGYLMRCVCVSHGGLANHEVDHLRLFRNDPRIRFTYRVHEQVAPSVQRAGGKTLATDVVIRHVGYGDTELYRHKQERNLRLIEMACQEHPLEPAMLYYRGESLLDLDRPAEALVSLNLCANLVPRGTAVARRVPVHLADAYTREGMIREADAVLVGARSAYPTDSNIALAQAMLLYRRGQLERAESELSLYVLVSANASRPEVFVGDPSISSFRARSFLAALRYLLARYAEAEADARLVVETCPDFGEGWLLLGDALLAQRKEPEFDALLAQLASRGGTEIARLLLRISRCARAGDTDGSLRLVEEGLRRHGPHTFLERARARLTGDIGPWFPSAYILSTKELPGTTA